MWSHRFLISLFFKARSTLKIVPNQTGKLPNRVVGLVIQSKFRTKPNWVHLRETNVFVICTSKYWVNVRGSNSLKQSCSYGQFGHDFRSKHSTWNISLDLQKSSSVRPFWDSERKICKVAKCMTQNMTHTSFRTTRCILLIIHNDSFHGCTSQKQRIFFLDLHIILQERPFKLCAVHLGTSVSGPLLRMLNYWSLNGLIIVWVFFPNGILSWTPVDTDVECIQSC